jgi:cyclic di-GMP phosphodiesterase Gmr
MREEHDLPNWPGSTQFLGMPCMDDPTSASAFSENAVLFAHFGTPTPCWRLSDDSNALHLAAVEGMSTFTVALDKNQASIIRAFTGVTSHTVIDVQFFNDRQKLNLVGRKVDQHTWAGTAANYADTPSVAASLAQGLAFAEQVVSEVNSMVVIIDSNLRIKRFNQKCEEFSGIREQDVIGQSAHALFMVEGDRNLSEANIAQFFNQDRPYEAERTVNTVNGPRTILWRNKFVQSGSGEKERYLICSGVDVTEERKAQAKLIELANVDSLTGLPNRHSMYEQMRAAVNEKKAFGLIFLDLDNFKTVNDHYGHVTGDKLIHNVAQALTSCLREGDVAARLGGDEFLIMVQDSSSSSIQIVAQRILDRLRIPFNIELLQLYTSCSIGIAICPEHGKDVEELVRSADTAMYAAKEAGKRIYRVFSPEMNQKVAQYMWLETNLRNALEQEELELHYQPKICLKTGAVRGVEALLRWNSSERGRVSPMEFIPYAEESGLILPLGRWVLQAAARQAAEWRAKGIEVRIAVNVSARQLGDFMVVDELNTAIKSAGMNDCMLDVELTESCLALDEALAVSLMTNFRQIGARVHLDDFGTGYSSLSQLARLPLDTIKLDRTFISGIDANSKSQALVRSMVAVAQEFDLDVIAEGVETSEEAAFLKSIGVDYAQGYFYGRPMAAAAFEAWLSEGHKLRLVA